MTVKLVKEIKLLSPNHFLRIQKRDRTHRCGHSNCRREIKADETYLVIHNGLFKDAICHRCAIQLLERSVKELEDFSDNLCKENWGR